MMERKREGKEDEEKLICVDLLSWRPICEPAINLRPASKVKQALDEAEQANIAIADLLLINRICSCHLCTKQTFEFARN